MTREVDETDGGRSDEDAQLAAVIAGVRNDQWERLRELAGDLLTRPETAGEWDQVGFRWSDTLTELVRLLYDAGLVTGVIDWVARLDSLGEVNLASVKTAKLTDLVCMVTAMVRSDRFNEGALAGFVDSGVFPTAVLRLSEPG